MLKQIARKSDLIRVGRFQDVVIAQIRAGFKLTKQILKTKYEAKYVSFDDPKGRINMNIPVFISKAVSDQVTDLEDLLALPVYEGIQQTKTEVNGKDVYVPVLDANGKTIPRYFIGKEAELKDRETLSLEEVAKLVGTTV